MSDVIARPEFRFGRTIVSVAVDDLLDQEAEGIVVAANRRGVLGPALGGSEIEREAMAMAPFDLGEAIVTGAARLEERGVRAVLHAVVHPALGEPARSEDIRRVAPALLQAASRGGLRTLAMPLLGVESLAEMPDAEAMIVALVDELVVSLRRWVPRVDRLTIVCRFEEEADVVEAALARARERIWIAAP